jgi:hypothetical protein
VAYQYNIAKDKPLPSEYLGLKDARSQFSLRYFLRHKKIVRDYCVQDCIVTKELAENWISSCYLAEKVLLANGIATPFFNDLPYNVQELAWRAFYGGRFELIQRRAIGECYLYALTTLSDITSGRWVTGSLKIHPSAAVGFFCIRAHVDDCVKIVMPNVVTTMKIPPR